MRHIVPRIVFNIQCPYCSMHEGRCPEGAPKAEFVVGVLGVGDPSADFLVVHPPAPLLTFPRLGGGGLRLGVLEKI